MGQILDVFASTLVLFDWPSTHSFLCHQFFIRTWNFSYQHPNPVHYHMCSPFTISLYLLLIVLQVHKFSTHVYVHHLVNLSHVPSHFSITHCLLEHFCALLCSLSTFNSLMCYFLCSIYSSTQYWVILSFKISKWSPAKYTKDLKLVSTYER